MEVTVTLNIEPEREVVIPITAAAQGETSADDYSAVDRVTFASGETEQSFVFEATDDDENDDGGERGPGVRQHPARRGERRYDRREHREHHRRRRSAGHGELRAVQLHRRRGELGDGDRHSRHRPGARGDHPPDRRRPGRDERGRLLGLRPSDLRISGETEQSFVFEATDDDLDDDGESVVLGFGSILPAGVSAGTTAESTVSITDDDDPRVEVSFEQSSYTVDEGSSVTVKVTLSEDPEREVIIPLTAAAQGETSADDYSVVDRVTFNAGDTTRSFVFEATADDLDDDGESVVLGFGSILPDRGERRYDRRERREHHRRRRSVVSKMSFEQSELHR